MSEQRPQASVAYTSVVTAIWAGLGLVRLLTHEMWRDELQAWMIARGSDTPLQLISNLRYEGHPGLWPFCLFLVSRFTDSPVGMQLLNLAVGAATVAILVRWAPFPRWVTASIAFGYYLAYEYGTLSRSYSLGVLCLVAFCALAAGRARHRTTLMAVALSLLALTSIYGVVVAVGLGAGVLWEAWSAQLDARQRRRQIVRFAGIVAAGMFVTVLSIRQPADAGFTPTLRLEPNADRALHAMGSVWRGLAPVPPLDVTFWNRDILEPLPWVRAAAGVALFAAAVLVLRGHPGALLTFLAGAGGLFVFTYAVYQGGVRHHGHYFLLFTAACWIAAARPAEGQTRAWSGMLAILAAVQLAIGGYASMIDLRATFSGSRDAATYIRQHYPADIPIVVDPELPGVPVAAWLRREVFFAQSNRLGGFVLWNREREASSLERAVAAADRLSGSARRDVLLVTTHSATPPPRFQHVGHFEGEIVKEETYEVYVLKPTAARP